MSKEINVKINTEGADKAVKDIDKVNDALGETNDQLEEVEDNADALGKVGTAAGKSAGGVKKMGKAFGSFTKSLGVIGLLVIAFELVKSVLEKQQPVLDAMDTAMTAIQIGVTAVVKGFTNLHKSVTESKDNFDGIVKVMKGLWKVAKNVISLGLTPLKLAFIEIKAAAAGVKLAYELMFGDEDSIQLAKDNLADIKDDLVELKDEIVKSAKAVAEGTKEVIDSAAEAYDELTEIAKKAADEAKKIADQNILDQAAEVTRLKNLAIIKKAENELLLQQFDERAEKLRQERDNINLNFEQRQKASADLKKVLEDQGNLMEKNAQIALDAAIAEEKTNDTSTELIEKRILAEKELADVKATVTGLDTEQGEQDRALALEKSDSMAKAIVDEVELANVSVKSELLKTQAVIDGIAKQLEIYEKAGQTESQQYKDLVAEKKLTEAQKVQLVKDTQEEIEDLIKEINEEVIKDDKKVIKAKYAAQLEEAKKSLKFNVVQLAALEKALLEQADKEIAKIRKDKLLEAIIQYNQAARDTVEIFNTIFDEITESRNRKVLEQNEIEQSALDARFEGQLNSLQARADEELRINGEVTEATQNAIIQANNDKLKAQHELDLSLFQQQQRVDDENNKQAKKVFLANKAFAIATIAIDTAITMVKTGASLGYPAAIPFIVAAGIAGTAQSVAAAATRFNPQDTAGTRPKLPNYAGLISDSTSDDLGDLEDDVAFNRQELSAVGSELIGGTAGQQQIQVTVLESQITQTQETINTIVETSEFGG